MENTTDGTLTLIQSPDIWGAVETVVELDKEQVKRIALENGFKLKDQGDGVMDLNPYVYDFANALVNNFIKRDVK